MTRRRISAPLAGFGAALLLAVALGVGKAGAAPSCTIEWDGGGGATTTWSTVANWNLSRVPNSDDVVCLPAGFTVVHASGTTTVKTVLSQAAFSVTGGTLNLTDSGANESSVTTLTLSSGAIGGAGTLVVSGTMTWTGGTMQDAGVTRIAAAALLAHNGTVNLSNGRLLDNAGRLEFQGAGWIDDLGVAPLVRNTGTIEKVSTGLSQIFAPLDNDGVVKAAAGVLSLQGGSGPEDADGDFGAASATGTVQLDAGTFRFANGASWLGGVTLDGATVNVLPGATATASGANAFSTGTLGGTGTFDVVGTVAWTGGTMRDAGTTRIAPTGAVHHNGNVNLQDGRLLENEGLIQFLGAGWIDDLGAAPLVHNTGTIEKLSADPTATIFAPLDNDGLVKAGTGVLSLQGPSASVVSDGDFGALGSPGTVRFDAGTFRLGDGARFLGGVNLDGATVNVEPLAAATASGSNSFSTGTLGGTGALDVSGDFAWTGGTMRDAGTTRITASGTLHHSGTVSIQDGRLLENAGLIRFEGAGWIDDLGTPPLVHNSGTIEKVSADPTATLFAPLDNDGLVKAGAGVLSLQGGSGGATSVGSFGAAAATGTVQLDAGTFQLGNGSALLGGVRLDGGTLNVAGGATASASGANSFSSGLLGGTGTLNVSGTLAWTGGTMRDGGITRITAAGTVHHNGTVALQDGRLLQNVGRIELQGAGWIDDTGTPPLVQNTGTIEKVSAAPTATIFAPLDNDGIARSASGTLSLQGGDGTGSSAGDFSTAAGASLFFDAGTFDLAQGARLLGGVTLDGATLNVSPAAMATATGANAFSAGILGGTGTFEVSSGTFSLTGGTMRDAGTTKVAAGATLSQQGNLILQDGRRLENAGLYELRGSSQVSQSGTAPLLLNTGVLERKAGSGLATVSATFDNDGTVVGSDGLLNLTGGDGAREQNGTFRGTAPGFVAFTSGSFDLGPGTAFAGRVRIGGGQVTIPTGVTVSATDGNEQTSGTLTGDGTLSVDGPFLWSGGTMEGSGRTMVPAGQVLTMTTCCPTLSGTRRLENDGTVRVNGGQSFLTGNAVLDNDGLLELLGGANEELGGQGRLLNDGTVRKSAGTGSTSLDVDLVNSGLVEATSGTLALGGGDGAGAQTGDFGGAAGEVVFEFGDWNVDEGTRFLGGVGITNATLAVAAGYTLPVTGAARLAGGSLVGPGNAEFAGTLAWTGGSMEGAALTTIAPGAVVTMDAGLQSTQLQDGRVLLNRGRIDLVSGALFASDSTLVNEALIDFTGDADVEGSFGFGGQDLFHNTGTVRKSGGAGESELSAAIDNDGTIEAASGSLALRGGLVNYSAATRSLTSGAFVARNATLELNVQPLLVNAATIVLDGASAQLVAREDPDDPEQDALGSLVRNAGAGELRLEGGADLAVPAALRNAGLLVLGEGSTLTSGGAFLQSGGRTELRGPGSVLDTTAYTQAAGTLLVETAAGGAGRVDSAGPAALGGGLTVETRAGFGPDPDTAFRFLDAASVTGSFDPFVEATPGIDYDVDYDATGATLRVVSSGRAPAVPRDPAVAPVPTAFDDRAFSKLSGAWVRKASPGFYEGTYTMSSRKGARLVRAGIEARYLGLLVSRCRRCGVVEAYWNGRLLRRVRLDGRPERRLVDLATFPAAETGTLTLRVASSRRQVRIDGLVATR